MPPLRLASRIYEGGGFAVGEAGGSKPGRQLATITAASGAQMQMSYGVPGRYYKAYVCIWGGSDGDGDTRYFYTSAKKAVVTPS